MKPWRVVLAGLVFGGLSGGLFAGPEWLRFVLFWVFFFAVPGALAMRFIGCRQAWVYILAGAISGALGFIGATYPTSPNFAYVWASAFVGAAFGWGWKFLLHLRGENRGEISPIGRTVSWWTGL